VYYKGLSDVRLISKKDLEPHGLTLDKDLRWDARTPAINIDAPDELIKILKGEGTFTVSEIKDDGTIGDDLVTATISDDTVTSAKVVDADTGQESENPNGGEAAADKGKSKKG
jgi:hypothetical protein